MSRIFVVLLLTVTACSEPPPPPPTAQTPPPPARPEVNTETAELLRQMAELHRQGRYAEGLAMVEAELERDPERPRLYYNLGVFRGSSGDQDGAAEAFEEELRRFPGDVASHRSAAAAYTRLGRLEDSVFHLEKCLENAPDDSDCTYQLGRNLLALGLLEDARAHLEMAAEQRRDAAAWSELGALLRRQGELEQAAEAFGSALAHDEKHLRTLLNYGQTLLALGRTEDGEELLERHRQLAELSDQRDALQRASRQPGASIEEVLGAAQLYWRRGERQAAITAYERAHELDPTHPMAPLELADIYLDLGSLDEAERWAQTGLAADPKSPASHFILGMLYLERGDLESALRALSTSAGLGGWPPQAHLRVGAAFLAAGDPARAAAAVGEALRLDARNPDAWHLLANIHHHQQAVDEAHEAVRRATELAPELGDAWALLGLLRFEDGDAAGATDAFRAARAAHRLTLLQSDGIERLLEDFARQPRASAALELYRQVLTES